MKTYTPKASEIQRDWFVVDAEGMTLCRMSTEVARILRGKHKPTFAPHMDMGDHVIVVNADKVDRKMVHRHSGYPGGLHSETYANLMNRRPAEAVRRSIVGMLPKNRLGRQQARKLKIYAGETHPHAAQKPRVLEIAGAHTHARRES